MSNLIGAAPVSHEELTHRAAVTDVLLRYFRGLDRADYELVRSCFAEDATIEFTGEYAGGREEFVDWIASPAGNGGCTRTLHIAGNIVIEVDGDVAYAETYGTAHHTGEPGHDWADLFVTYYLRYVDRFELRGGRWQIARRHALIEWIHDDDRDRWHEVDSGSQRSREDPSYRVDDAGR